MKTFLVLALYFTAVFAAPPTVRVGSPDSGLWGLHTAVLDDFEASLRKMRDEFEQLEKSLQAGFKFDVPNLNRINGTSIFDIDPSKVKNESFSDTKIVDDKIVHTEEKTIANGNSVVHFKKVEITPKDSVSPSVPAVENTPSSSKNNLDSDNLDETDNDQTENDEKFQAPKDVEEIENVSPPKRSEKQKIYLI